MRFNFYDIKFSIKKILNNNQNILFFVIKLLFKIR